MAGINFDFTGGALPAGITFTRASIGTYNSSGNILTTASNNVARFNYISGVANLLIEGSATNLVLQSNNFSAGSWNVPNGNTITAAQFVSVDGTNNGWKLVSSVTPPAVFYQALTFSAAPYTVSVWAKQITGPAGITLLVGGFGSSLITTSAVLARLSFTATVAAGGGTANFYIGDSTINNAEGFYGTQVETGSVPTSYIPTTTTAVTRAADSATFTIPSGINQLTYTFDNNSTQTVSVSPGSYTIPTTLSRANIKSIVGSYAFDFTSGSLPAGMTFTRPSIGTYTNAGGTLITAGNDVARMNYVGGVSCLLVEGSATNLLIQSNNFTAAPWVTFNSPTVTAAQFVSPDGTNNGWSMNTGTGSGTIYQAQTFLNVAYTSSVWGKQITGSAAMGFIVNGFGPTSLPISTTIQRMSGTVTIPAASNFWDLQVYGTVGHVNGIYGAQLELGSIATSYIPTTTTAVTRAADSAVLTIPAGVNALLYTFDDGSTQQVSVTPGSYTIPVNLNRPNIKSVQGLSGFDFTSGTLPPGITFTRASIGTYFDSGNILRTASNNVARMNYVSGVSCLLIEGSATNLFTQSNNFTNAAWSNFNTSVITAAQFVSPDGSNNGWSFTSGTPQDGGVYELLTVSNIQYAISVWAKRIVGTAPVLFNFNGPGFPVATSAVLTRLSFTNLATAGSGLIAIQVNASSGSTNGYYGAQLETGSVVTSYIPTTTAAVTRAVDQATFTIPTGVTQLTYTFDDNSTQTVSATPGSYTIPTTLNRPNIKSIAWISQAAITPTPSPARLGTYQSFGLAANIPLQLTAGGTYRLYILNTGPGNLFVSTGNTPGPNATVMMIPPLKAAPLTTTAGAIWLSSDQDSTVSIAAMPR